MKKIVNIRIDNYRIYRNEVEIRLPNGENLLIYGENGSGKTSLAKGIANFFDSSISRETEFERNFFNSDETDGQIDISFAEYSPGTPINTTGIQTYRWSSLPSESTNKQRFIQSAARIHGFLDYSRLLKVYLHNEPDPNLFDLIVLDLLGSYYPPAERHTVKGKYDKIQEGLFNVWNRKERAHRRALNELDVFEDNIRETLDNCFRTVNSWLNDHFRHLALTVDYVLAPMEFRYGKCKKDWNIIQDLRLRIIGFDHNIRKYNHVLNEARLSAISMLIFLAVIKENPELCQYKFLYLDDAFIGLDNSNRRQILNIIKKDFTDWQVFISTYDLTWYHAACSILDGSWTKLEIYECLESGRQNIPLSVVTYRDEPMAKVMKYLSDHKSPDYPAAANYLRKGIEELLNKKCPHFAIRNDNCELIESYKLSSLINSVIDFFRQIIAHRESPASIIGTLTELKTHLSTLIHPLSHYSVQTPIYKNELLEVVNLYHSMDRSLSTYNYEEDIAVLIEKGHKVEVGIEGVSGWKRKYSFKLTQHLYLIPGEPSPVLSLCGVQICNMQGLDSKGKIEYESSPSSNSRIYKQMQYRSIESAYESLVGHIRDHEQKDDIITSNYLASTKFTDVDNKTVTLQDMIKDRSR